MGESFYQQPDTIWEQLLTGDIDIQNQLIGEEAIQAFKQVRESAVVQGKNIYDELVQKHREQLDKEREKGEYAFTVRRCAIERIGLPQVREYRLAQLTQEEQAWRKQLNQAAEVNPELMLLLLIRL